MLRSRVVYLGLIIGIFGVSLLIDHFVFSDTAWGIYNPGWTLRYCDDRDPNYITCTHSSPHTLVAERPLILRITPILGIGTTMLGAALVLFGQFPLPKKQTL